MSTLADRIEKALELRQMSKQGLDSEAGLSKGYTSRVCSEKRERVSPDILRRVARVLRVSYEWLATGEGAIAGDEQAAQVTDEAEYPNLALFQKTPEFLKASPRVRAWLVSLRPREGDRPLMVWAEALEMGKKLDERGILPNRGADAPMERGIAPKKKPARRAS
jgi:transcriptional regulator with XRE-family HTH domain